jgi:hypothetical protein
MSGMCNILGAAFASQGMGRLQRRGENCRPRLLSGYWRPEHTARPVDTLNQSSRATVGCVNTFVHLLPNHGHVKAASMGRGRKKTQQWELLSEQAQCVANSIRPYFPRAVSNETLATAVRAGAFLRTTRHGHSWVCLWNKCTGERCQGMFPIAVPSVEGEYDGRPLLKHWHKYHDSLVRLICVKEPSCPFPLNPARCSRSSRCERAIEEVDFRKLVLRVLCGAVRVNQIGHGA